METLDADEDGEAGAESPMLFVTRAIKVSNALVMVSRWFGGVLLGPSRFAIIKDMLSRGYKAYRASVEAGTYVAP
jgi:putative IMPACT (imprinted ancient) family translation regulator